MNLSPVSNEQQKFAELLRAPDKREECLKLLQTQQAESLKRIKKTMRQCAFLAFVATVMWMAPRFLTLPEGVIIKEVFRVMPLACVLGVGFLIFRALTAWILIVDLNSEVRCLQLAQYIDEKAK